MNKRGIILIVIFCVIAVLASLAAIIISRSVSESRLTQRFTESNQAFWLAEAGANQGLERLRSSYDNLLQIPPTQLNAAQVDGGYSVIFAASGVGGLRRTVTATGFIPFAGAPRVARTISVVMAKAAPTNFYNNAIYTAGDLDFNGGSYTVVNNEDPLGEYNPVVYAGDKLGGAGQQYDQQYHDGSKVDPVHDDSITPLARLDFQRLYNLSNAQDNVYTVQKNKLVKKSTMTAAPFPTTFYYNNNVANGPNIVYIEGDLTLNGDIGEIGGFYVVVGKVITAPDVTQEAVINGHGTVNGAIYTRGSFRINGGGGDLNINGGVWSGTTARLNGNAKLTYNKEYMHAIGELEIDTAVQVVSWQDTQNPFILTP